MDERRFNARGEMVVESEATASIIVNGDTHHEVAVGNGPVNAVDTAIRKALVKSIPSWPMSSWWTTRCGFCRQASRPAVKQR